MARDPPTKTKDVPQVLEREINLTLLNAKINDLMGLTLEIAKKVRVETATED